MKSFVSTVAVAGALALAPTMAFADKYWSNTSWTVFDISETDKAACSLETVDTSNSGGSLYSGIYLDSDGEVGVFFKDYAWDIKEGETISGMSLFVQYDDVDRSVSYDGGDWIRTDKYSFVTGVNSSLLNHYSQARRLAVFRDRGDGEPDVIVAIVSLAGSSVGVRKLRECVDAADVRIRREIERERTRPANPF